MKIYWFYDEILILALDFSINTTIMMKSEFKIISNYISNIEIIYI